MKSNDSVKLKIEKLITMYPDLWNLFKLYLPTWYQPQVYTIIYGFRANPKIIVFDMLSILRSTITYQCYNL